MSAKIVVFTTDNEARVIADEQNVGVLFVNSDGECFNFLTEIDKYGENIEGSDFY